MQRDEAQHTEVQNMASVSGRSVPSPLSISFHRVENFHVVRLGAVLLSLHVAVGPSKIRRDGAFLLFAKLDGATGPYLSLIHDMPLAKQPRRPHTSCFVPGKF